MEGVDGARDRPVWVTERDSVTQSDGSGWSETPPESDDQEDGEDVGHWNRRWFLVHPGTPEGSL